jgi:plasmid stabilization system protein ParE
VSYNLIVTTTAEYHIIDACVYYDQQQVGLADRFLAELYVAYNKIVDHPEYYSHISRLDGYRDISLHKFPFVVIYEVITTM